MTYDPDRDLAADERLCAEFARTPKDTRSYSHSEVRMKFAREAEQGWPDALARLRALREGPLGERMRAMLQLELRIVEIASEPPPEASVKANLERRVKQVHDIARALGVMDVDAWLRGE